MTSHRVTPIDQEGQAVATARVTEQDVAFVGRIDLRHMAVSLRQQFEEYEEIVNAHTFSLLDEIGETIEDLNLKVVFEDGQAAALADVQICPRTKKVSFKVVKDAARER